MPNDVDFGPAEPELEFVRGDHVPPITIPLQDENGDPLAVSQYDLTAEIINPDGTSHPATVTGSGGSVIFSLTPAQSALAEANCRWCVTLATSDQSDVRTAILGRVKLIIK